MKIVSLDGFLVNPGDLDWAPFQALGEFVAYDHTERDAQVERLRDADAVLLNRSKLREEVFEACPRLRYLGLLSTGYNHVDMDVCRRHQVAVTNIPNYGERSVAQFALGLILELANGTGLRLADVRAGKPQERDAHWQAWVTPMFELSGKTLGVVGLGRIGQALAEMAGALGMRVLAYGRRETDAGRAVATYVPLPRLLRESDVVSLHLPLSPETHHIINAKTLAEMKQGAYLINTARGGLIDEAALMAALDRGHLGGCGLDVVAREPVRADNPLLAYENVRITPHIAWGYRSARARLLEIALDNLKSWLSGGRLNRLD